MRAAPPRTRLLIVVAVAVALAALATGPMACFDLKKPPCAFSCAKPPHTCPQDYACGDDGLCYRDGADPTTCVLTPPGEAGTDGGGTD